MNEYVADFETTTKLEDCRVWAYAITQIDDPTEYVNIGNSLDDFMEECEMLSESVIYFHNLKFDSQFIFNWLFRNNYTWIADKKFKDTKTFTTLISDLGMFYCFEIYFIVNATQTVKVKFIDSLKVLPFKVSEIAKCFNLPISKLEIDYDEEREVGHILTPIENEYVKNDVLIVAKALSILKSQGMTKMTQGSNALNDFKKIIGKDDFKHLFPAPAYDEFIRKSYKGGFTYAEPLFQSCDNGEGIVLDVNSLYPFVMYNRKLPFGTGIYYSGNYENDNLYDLYVQRINVIFELKENMLPTIQLKHTSGFSPTEYVTSSNNEWVELTLTSIDYELFKEHYNILVLEEIDGWKFRSTDTMFKDYIDKWIKIKIESGKTGNKAMRTLAKLMLNALYGKFAVNPKVGGKRPIFVDNMVKYAVLPYEDRDPLYIPVGTFITAWARDWTIRNAQKMKEKSAKYPKGRFMYADTDSMHLLGKEKPDDILIDDFELGAWKIESEFDRSRYLRAKCYIEEFNNELNVVVAGMPSSCHNEVTWDNFKVGTTYNGKLTPTSTQGGIVLMPTQFTIKP